MAVTKVAVLVSGGGTNLQAIIDAHKAGKIANCELSLVLSSKPDAYALTRAKDNGIPTEVIAKKDYPDRAEYTHAITECLKSHGIELVIMGGFMYILSPEFTEVFKNRIMNVHPALIPSFCGEGYYGLHVHEAALAKGVKLTGATVHFVNEICDGGPIILQKAVEIREGDTPEILQRRVMEEAEWKILPRAIDLFCRGKLSVEGNIVHIAE